MCLQFYMYISTIGPRKYGVPNAAAVRFNTLYFLQTNYLGGHQPVSGLGNPAPKNPKFS